MSNRFIIGVTGPTGAGKSTVCGILKDSGFTVLSADEIYHNLITKNSPLVLKIADRFGQNILDSDGGINRSILSDIVFSDKTALFDLNNLTHTAVIDEMNNQMLKYEALGHKQFALDIPLLFETGSDKNCDAVICVLSESSSMKQRIISRDKLTENAAMKRLNAAKPNEYYTNRCDNIILNNGTKQQLDTEVAKIIQELKESGNVKT